MKAYTISKLAEDANVSVDIVRNYKTRGMLQPCECTDCGYGIYDEPALSRLRFIRTGKEAGISLNDLEILCKALDEQDTECILRQASTIKSALNEKIEMLISFQSHLIETLSPTRA